MSKEYFIQFAADEIQYFIDFLTNNIQGYKLNELTSGYCGDIPSIVEGHPLALEYGNLLSSGDADNYTSILPAIGIELLDDTPSQQNTLGNRYKLEEVTQSFVDGVTAISLEDRFNNGIVMGDVVKQSIQDMITAKSGEPLYSRTNMYMQDQMINISIWSDHGDVTRILYVIVRGLLNRAKRDLSSQGVKNVMIRGQNALYNYEFGKTLFGSEFNVTLINTHKDIEVDTDLVTLNEVEHYLNETGKAGPDFVTKNN